MSGVAFRCGTVAIVGQPNVGKSTLLNALVGQKISITSRRPQTTRQRITGISTTPLAQLIFVDTPGFQTEYQSTLNRSMNRTISRSLQETDLVLWMLDAAKLDDHSSALLKGVPAGKPLLIALNKIDRVRDKRGLLPRLQPLQEQFHPAAIIPISAKTGYQIDVLREALIRELPEREQLYANDELTTVASRVLAAEMVREKLFRSLGAELPYSVAVETEKFEEDGRMYRIHATILVDKDSQKAIVIGNKGDKLKAIGTLARHDMEKLFGAKVYLELWVKVRQGWAEDRATLKRIGME
jgi:GTP-binding protein Era